MPTLELTNEQVVELVKQLPPERQREALYALASAPNDGHKQMVDEQVIKLVDQLPPAQQDALVRRLILRQWTTWAELSQYGEERARIVAAERGRTWDHMTEEEKEAFVDDLIHEE